MSRNVRVQIAFVGVYSTELHISLSIVLFLRLCLGCVVYHSFGLMKYGFDPPRKLYTNFRRKFVITLFTSTCIKVKMLSGQYKINHILRNYSCDSVRTCWDRFWNNWDDEASSLVSWKKRKFLYIYGFMVMIIVLKKDIYRSNNVLYARLISGNLKCVSVTIMTTWHRQNSLRLNINLWVLRTSVYTFHSWLELWTSNGRFTWLTCVYTHLGVTW